MLVGGRLWLAGAAMLMGTASGAAGGIRFCNEFDQTIRFAVAYKDGGQWVSEGWIEVRPKSCQADDKHTGLNDFYWRGETDWINVGGGKKSKWSWGKQRQFAVKDGPFSVRGADTQASGARVEGFVGPVTVAIPEVQEITLSILSATTTSTTVSSERDARARDPDYRACQNGVGDEAIAACDRALQSGKFDDVLLSDLHINRGAERRGKKDIEGAVADYEEAMRLTPKNPLPLVNRASIRFDKGDYDSAMADIEKAIGLDPKYVRAYTLRADIFREKEDLERALGDYRTALTLGPTDKQRAAIERSMSNVLIDRGVKQKDVDAEIADYNEALRLNPDSVIALNNRGAAFNVKGEYDKAIESLNHAIEKRPNYAMALRNRGDAYAGKGDRDNAIADYKLALDSNPEDTLKKQIEAALAKLTAPNGM